MTEKEGMGVDIRDAAPIVGEKPEFSEKKF